MNEQDARSTNKETMHHHNHQTQSHSRQEDAAQFGIPVTPGPGVEVDPVFATSEAALLVPGDKAKLDALNMPTLAAVLATGSDGGNQAVTGISNLILGALGMACIQMYTNAGVATSVSIESQGGNKALVLRAGENPGEVVGVLAINAPLLLEGNKVQLRGPVVMLDLPVADPHLVGEVWNDAGTLKVSAG